ncbi:MAG: glycerophosphodiester phosphodiesterase [Chloroflexi bacterium]|nr:glycerophosphodiester phosphodiesterase [Chloroflexota bacterium]
MKKILNIAHRGFTRDFSDNTLESFQAALDLEVDGIELDVQETADGEFIVYHDDAINGKPIDEVKYESLRGVLVQGKYKLPTLRETLKLLGGNTGLLIELKQVRSLEKLLTIFRAHTTAERVAIISFNSELISNLARLAPDIMRAVITGEPVVKPSQITQATRSSAIGVSCSHLTSELVSQAHAENITVFVWGCADKASVRRALQFDIDGIISDYPDVVKDYLNK